MGKLKILQFNYFVNKVSISHNSLMRRETYLSVLSLWCETFVSQPIFTCFFLIFDTKDKVNNIVKLADSAWAQREGFYFRKNNLILNLCLKKCHIKVLAAKLF